MENSRRTPSRQFLAQPRGQIGYHPLARTELAEERMREAWEALDGALNYTVADSASASTFPAWWQATDVIGESAFSQSFWHEGQSKR